MALSFKASREDVRLIAKIVDRGMVKASEYGRTDITSDRQSIHMDITACHCSGNPLRLQDMLDADDFNFAHDFFGINRHIDRETGEMMNHFVPRFTVRTKEAA